jgi:pyruvate-formate lyase-activating enzyme
MPAARREFQIFAKPIGATCNLDCHYCYYLRKSALYPQDEPLRMADDLLEEYIRQHIAACPSPTVFFAWHGGEPTALGVDYFRRIVALQHKHAPPGRKVMNGIQTNGTLLDEAWCRFLAEHKFFVGLSLDGTRALHDAYRLTKGGQPTHGRVVQALRLLQRHRIPTDTLCVVHDRNAGHPLEVYRYLREIGADYIQFLPLVNRDVGDERAGRGSQRAEERSRRPPYGGDGGIGVGGGLWRVPVRYFPGVDAARHAAHRRADFRGGGQAALGAGARHVPLPAHLRRRAGPGAQWGFLHLRPLCGCGTPRGQPAPDAIGRAAG